MNLTDYQRTPPAVAFDAVELEARRLGIGVLDSEFVGLVPRGRAVGHDTGRP